MRLSAMRTVRSARNGERRDDSHSSCEKAVVGDGPSPFHLYGGAFSFVSAAKTARIGLLGITGTALMASSREQNFCLHCDVVGHEIDQCTHGVLSFHV